MVEEMTYRDVGIVIPPGSSGRVYIPCPKCSVERTKPSNRNSKVLGVTLDGPKAGTWGCNHCGRTGSLTRGWVDDPEWRPREWLKPAPLPSPVSVTPDTVTPAGKVWTWLTQDRALPEEVLIRNGVVPMRHYMRDAADGKGAEVWVAAFPFTVRGEHVNTKYRTGTPKLMQMEPGAKRTWYGGDDLTGEHTAVIVEGEIDALSCEAAGYVAVSVPNGAPALDVKSWSSLDILDFSLLSGLTKVIIATDADTAGRRLGEELARRVGTERCWRVTFPEGCKDMNDVLRQHGAAYVTACLISAEPWPIAGLWRASDVRLQVLDLYDTGLSDGPSTGWPSLDAVYRPERGMLTIITGVPGMGKALALNTPIPTPDGWTTISAIREGDTVFAPSGCPTRVIATSPVIEGGECYRVRFDGGEEIIAHADHEWVTETCQDRRRGRGGNVRETREIASRVMYHGKRNHSIRRGHALTTSQLDLPIPPYTLGAWLGDGESASSLIACTEEGIIEAIRADGYRVEPIPSDSDRYTIFGLKGYLRKLGVLRDKRIPMMYLRSSRDQRWKLLAGLVDTDGHVSAQGTVEIVTIKADLAVGIAELISSLGWVPSIKVSAAMLNGKECGPRWRIRFTPDQPVACLERKRAAFFSGRGGGRIQSRYITACDPVQSVPTRCISVSDPSGMFLAGRTMIPTHNSHWLHALLLNLIRGPEAWRVGLCSPEHQPLKLLMALLSSVYLGKPFDQKRADRRNVPRMTKQELERALDALSDHVYFDLPERPTIQSVMDVAKNGVRRHGWSGIAIDPWSSLEVNRPPGMSEGDYVGYCLRMYQDWLRVDNVHGWMVAHPFKIRELVKEKDDEGREVLVEPVVEPYDISGSAHWYNMADFILSIWRNKSRARPKVAVHVKKCRYDHLGQEGAVVWFDYDPASGQYIDVVTGSRGMTPKEGDPWDRTF